MAFLKIDMTKKNAHVKRAALVLAYAAALGFLLFTLNPFNLVLFEIVDIISIIFAIKAITKYKETLTSSGKYLSIGLMLLNIALFLYVLPLIFKS